jgi:hypothetical protein
MPMLNHVKLYTKNNDSIKIYIEKEDVEYKINNIRLYLFCKKQFDSSFKLNQIKNINLDVSKSCITLTINSDIMVDLYNYNKNELLELWDILIEKLYYILENKMRIRKTKISEKIKNDIEELKIFNKNNIKRVIESELFDQLYDYEINFYDKENSSIIVISNLLGNKEFNIRKNKDMINDFLSMDIKIKFNNKKEITEVKYIRG